MLCADVEAAIVRFGATIAKGLPPERWGDRPARAEGADVIKVDFKARRRAAPGAA